MREIPFVFDDLHRHPEKGLYFFRKKAIPILKQDEELWRLRQQMVILTYLAVALPTAFVLIGICVAIITIFLGK